MVSSFFYEFLSLVLFPFVVWVISCRGFISGRLALAGDASHYYSESRFFFDNIARGVYPLWNPDYSGGVPWNFYLRRIGEANPFYWIITAFKLSGIPALQGYLVFHVLYYFLGLLGFWLLARLFLKDRLTATAAYILLLFSWGGQIFCSFEVLVFVPLVWFFYFVFAFTQEYKKHQFLGIIFSASLLVTTYIPFFSLFVICSFLFFYFLLYKKETFEFFQGTFSFVSKNKTFAVFSLLFFLLACVPNIDFYFESRGGGFVMLSRHLGSKDASAVAGPENNIKVGGIVSSRTVWDIIGYSYFDKVFSDQEDMGIRDFNIPYLFFLVLLIGLINPVSRRTAVLLLTGVFIILACSTKGRLYPFFLSHVFIFRYMRMLQLLFWLAVLPMMILMAMEQLRVFLKNYHDRKDSKVLIFVIIVHVIFFFLLLKQEGIIRSSYFAILISLLFFILAIKGFNRKALAVILCLGLIIQPVTYAGIIARNSEGSQTPYIQQNENLSSKEVYYDNPWISQLRQFIPQEDLKRFLSYHLLLVDNTMPEYNFSLDKSWEKLDRNWRKLQNFVLLPSEGSFSDDFRSLAPQVLKAQAMDEGIPGVRVLSSDVNTLSLKTALDRPRFLLWTNGYHQGWHVYIDGHEGRLLRSDYAFKGAWIPAGDHKVVFRFSTPFRYLSAYFLMLFYVIVLLMILALAFREGFMIGKEVVIGD